MKNYIKMFMEDNDLKINQTFKIKNFNNTEFYFNEYYRLMNDKGINASYIFAYDVLLGKLEIEKSILDEVEREYLSAVIKPFANRVRCICKIESEFKKTCFIRIMLIFNEEINLPYFEKNLMYKGMEVEKQYTLEELGLK